MKKRILSLLCVLCLIVGLLPTTALAAAATNIQVTDATYYENGSAKSVTTSFYWNQPDTTSRLVLMTNRLRSAGEGGADSTYGDFSNMGSYKSSFTNFAAVKEYDATNRTFGIIADSGEDASITKNTTNTLSISFKNTDIPLSVDKTYYVYLWTQYQGYCYPDNLILAFKVENGGLKYAVADTTSEDRNALSSTWSGVVSQQKYSVTVTPAANMTKTAESGSAAQTDLNGAMTPVVYTAAQGYEFPEDYAVNTVNGIMVRRDSATQITVYGTPSANATITLVAPTRKLLALEEMTFNYAYDVQRGVDYPTKGQEVTATKSTNSYPLDANGNHLTVYNGAWTLTKAGTYFYVNSLGDVDPDLTGIVTAFATKYSVDKDTIVVHELKKDGVHIAYGVVVAYDTSNGYALFVGDTWSYTSGGAGYLLSVNEITDPSKEIEAEQIATDFVPTCSIELNQTTDYTFTGTTTGYTPQTPVTVTVSNTGSAATGALNVTLSGTNADSFTLGNVDDTFKAGIAENGSDTFTVVPKTGLTAGTYTATVTVSGVDVASKSFAVCFTVTAPTTYNVTFVGGEGATGSAPTQAATVAGGKFNLPNNPFTKTGYTFAGWNDGANTYAVNAEYTMPAKAVTFTAQWTADTYTVTFNANGGTGTMGNQTYTYGVEQALTANAFSKTGHTFAGWATTADGNVVYSNSQSVTIAENTTLYAKWTADTYTVTLNANGGAIASGKNVTGYTYGVGATLPVASDMTKTGYTFAGWYTTDTPGDSDTAVTEISNTDTGNKTFYAKWTANQYTVTLDATGGTGAPASIEVTYDGTYAGLVTPTRTAYTFAGWFTAAEGGTEVTTATVVALSVPTTLYARWTLNSDAELNDVHFTHAYDVQRSPAFPAKGNSIHLSSYTYPLMADGRFGTTNLGDWTLSEVGTYYSIKNTASANLTYVVNSIANNYSNIEADEIVVHELKDGSTHIAYGVVVAYSAADGCAVFLGDTHSTGAGYLLSYGAKSDPADVTATTVPTDFVQALAYRIMLDRTGTYIFTDAVCGYAAQTPVTVTVTNAGKAETGALDVTLSGTDADKFTLSSNSVASIAVSGNDSFTVVPNTGLAIGTYTAVVTVGNTNAVPKEFNISFTVAPAVYTVTFDANGGTVTPASDTTAGIGKLSSLPTPTRSGSYSFKGWYTAANGGTQITTDTVFTENTTIFAQWTYTGGGSSSTPTYPVDVLEKKDDNIKPESNYRNAKSGTTVTITVTPDPYYQVEGVIVKDKDGKLVKVTENKDGTFSFKMPASKVTVEAIYAWDNPFVDVAEDAYYAPAVEWALNEGVTGGTTATTFAPNVACTRAQMVTFLWRAAGCPEPITTVNPFTDVDMDNYYGKAVLWAVENGITNGTGDGTTFSPYAICTRAQMATFLCRMEDGEAVGTVNSFTDVPADVYYADPVLWAVENGITNGTGDGTTFSPNATCTRGQMVTFLYRCFAK